MTYMADSARFEECFSGVGYPVAQEGDYLALGNGPISRAASGPGAPVMVHLWKAISALRPPMEGAAAR